MPFEKEGLFKIAHLPELMDGPRMPYYGFKTLALAMWWHNFVRHDGPVSILRSFSRADWESYFAAAGLCGREVEIEERWPARLCVSRVKR